MLFAAAVAVCALNACNRDGLQDETPLNGGGDRAVRYLAFALNPTDGSPLRTSALPAAELDEPFDEDTKKTVDGIFNPGRADERAISDDMSAHTALLFNADGSWYGAAEMQKPESTDQTDPKANPIYLAEMELVGDALPAQVLVVLNARPWRLDNLIEKLDDEGANALQTALQWVSLPVGGYDEEKENENEAPYYFKKDDVTYFTMSSSVYGSYSDGKIVATAPAGGESSLADYVYNSPESALRNPLTIYVERLAAKYTVSFLDKNGVPTYLSEEDEEPFFINPAHSGQLLYLTDWNEEDAGKNEDAYRETADWKIHIVNWGVNAVEPNTFLFKNMTNSRLEGIYYADDSFRDEFFWWPKSESDLQRPRRSFWAVDQHYAGGESTIFGGENRPNNNYPQQYREAYTAPNLVSYENPDKNKNAWALDYYSFADMVGGQTRAMSRYSLENTFNPNSDGGLTNALADDGHLRVGTHIIVAAQLLIKGFDSNNAWEGKEWNSPGDHLIPDVKTKYYNGAEFMNEGTMLKTSVYSLLGLLAANPTIRDLHSGENISLTLDDGKLYADETLSMKITYENAGEYFKTVPAQVVGGDGWATLGLKDDTDVYIKDEDGKPKKITDLMESVIYDLLTPVRVYTDGCMYYAIPVLHEKTFDENGAFVGSDPATGATKLEIGDVGVVRNHWYRVQIGSIGSLGTPVHDPDQPIIPNHEPVFRSLGVQIEILPWSEIKLGDVIL